MSLPRASRADIDSTEGNSLAIFWIVQLIIAGVVGLIAAFGWAGMTIALAMTLLAAGTAINLYLRRGRETKSSEVETPDQDPSSRKESFQ